MSEKRFIEDLDNERFRFEELANTTIRIWDTLTNQQYFVNGMTPDSGWKFCTMFMYFFSETKKLREENEKLIQKNCIPCELVNSQTREIDKLKEENEQLKFENETLKSNYQREIQSSIDFCNAYSKTNGELLEKIEKLEKENEQLRQTMQKVCELLEEEVDLFSEKATEHDIVAYSEMLEFDNKDAYYMCTATKKAIQTLKKVI